MNAQKITANDLLKLNKNKTISFDKANSFSSSPFWYYTSLNTANLILENHCFYCSNLAEMNDVNESELHKPESKMIHALCFCNSDTEKIPMWYLYSGITGKGTSIGFTPATMIKFINSIETIRNINNTVTLHKGEDFDLEFGWIYYRKEDRNSVKYRNKWYYINDNSEMFEKNNYFIKDYPWEYEKEFRVVIKNKTKISYDKLVVDFPDEIYKTMKIRFAPEFDEQPFLSLLQDYKGFQKFLSKKFLYSKLNINMNLCKRNKKEIIENFSDVVDNENVSNICNKIRENNDCNLAKDRHGKNISEKDENYEEVQTNENNN
jgi:hypothetical protein